MFGSTTNTPEEISSYGDYIEKLRERMQYAHVLARQHLGAVAERQKQTYDGKGCLVRYVSGELVWYRTEMGQLRMTPKLRHAFEGPFVVVKKINDLNYIIQLGQRGPTKVVHHDRLKKYEGKKNPKWAVKATQSFRQ